MIVYAVVHLTVKQGVRLRKLCLEVGDGYTEQLYCSFGAIAVTFLHVDT